MMDSVFPRASTPGRFAATRISGWLCLIALSACPPIAHAEAIALTHADAPVQLIRKTTVFNAAPGTVLLAGDVVTTTSDSAQLEFPGGTVIGLGPETCIMIATGAPAPDLTLVRGWAKVQAPGRIKLATATLALSATGSGIVHQDAASIDMMVESGSIVVSALDNVRPPAATLTQEQYLAVRGSAAFTPLARSPRSFIAAVPRNFFDPLVPVAMRVKAVQPTPLRDVSAADVVALNGAAPALRKQLATRFAPRMTDPAFRTAAAKLLADIPEWRQIVRDGERGITTSGKKRTAVLNNLF